MDIHITYETLFDLLRKERSLDELQSLDNEFWTHVVDYLRERTQFMQKTSLAEQEKTRLQLQNIKRIIKEIYEHRERKILRLAMNVVKTESAGYVDTRNMLAEEKLMFNEQVHLLTKYKKGILSNVCNNDLPDIKDVSVDIDTSINETSSNQEDADSSKEGVDSSKEDAEDTAGSSSDKENSSQVFSPSSSSEPSLSEKENAVASEEKNETKESSQEDEVLVKFVTSVPKFMGKNKKVFGPFQEGTIISLPSSIANILLKKNKVQNIMNS